MRATLLAACVAATLSGAASAAEWRVLTDEVVDGSPVYTAMTSSPRAGLGVTCVSGRTELAVVARMPDDDYPYVAVGDRIGFWAYPEGAAGMHVTGTVFDATPAEGTVSLYFGNRAALLLIRGTRSLRLAGLVPGGEDYVMDMPASVAPFDRALALCPNG